MIITSELADDITKEKFVPVLRSGEWNQSLPRWLRSKSGFDLRGDPILQSAFNGLLQALHHQGPRPPERGAMPVFTPRTVPQLNIGAAAPASAAHGVVKTSAPLELPPAADKFFGREPERKRLVQRLRERRNSAVVGDAGFGKTALAAQLSARSPGRRRRRSPLAPIQTAFSSLTSTRLRVRQSGPGTRWQTGSTALTSSAIGRRRSGP